MAEPSKHNTVLKTSENVFQNVIKKIFYVIIISKCAKRSQRKRLMSAAAQNKQHVDTRSLTLFT